MARRRYYRRRFRLKLKKHTVYTIAAIILFGIAGLITLSFFQEGTVLALFQQEAINLFGWSTLLVPLILATYGLLMIGFKSKLSRTNIPVGLTISFIGILGLSKAGRIGLSLFAYLEDLISTPGSIIIFLGTFIIGLTILFNTSLDQVLFWALSFFKTTRSFIEKHVLASIFSKKRKPAFSEKRLPMKVKGGDLDEERKTQMDKTVFRKPISVSSNKTEPSTGIPTPKAVNLGVWEYPPSSLFSRTQGQKADRGDIKMNAATIEKTLGSFGIQARVVEVNLGPAVTQYALEIALGTKISKLTALERDLALALAAPTGQIRMEAPIPGRNLVGIEIPNRSLQFVTIKQMLQSPQMRQAKGKLTVGLGLDVSGQPVVADIARMPHVLIAGTTGSGKSVLINSWISTLLFRTTPNEVKLILVDPKRVELTSYNDIPHLLTPVIVEIEKIVSALKWALKEMDRRYKMFAKVKARNIDSYHEKAGFQTLPYIVIFIDELADLMAFAPVEVEDSITRIAQMSRATGIHLVVSTQRPSTDVITGLIKANIPCRIAFNVSSMIDSRVVLDMPGAEKLLGRGDMLFVPPDQAKPTRIQGTFISETEVKRLADFLKRKDVPVEYTEEVTSMPVKTKKSGISRVGSDGRDELFADAVRIACNYDRASASLLQRRLSVGYARAARILDQLEEAGIVGPREGTKPREVLIQNAEEYLAQMNEEIIE